jgi:methyltransferase-like protein
VKSARVLELGSAAGGNIIPLACTYPDAKFIGVDSALVQVEAGRQMIDALSLTNIELIHADLLALDESLGRFDFIICHGVFSWVPPDVQKKILWIAANLLAPDGIAYISYNTYPGWHTRGIIRQLLLQHTSHDSDARTRVAAARQLLSATAKITSRAENYYSELLNSEAKILESRSDEYIYHEHLAENCEPFYFRDFMGRARGAGLSFLGEADLTSFSTLRCAAAIRCVLPIPVEDVIEREQYIDFVSNRTFRESLLLKGTRTPALDIPSHVMWPLHIASSLKPVEPSIDVKSSVEATFVSRTGEAFSTPSPLLKATLMELGRHWPCSLPFGQLLETTSRQLGIRTSAPHWTILGQTIVSAMIGTNVIEVSVDPPCFTVTPTDSPTASKFARWQSLGDTVVTNLRHERVEITAVQQRVLVQLDGAKKLESIARDLGLSLDELRHTVAELARLALILS